MEIVNKITMKSIGAQPAPHSVESARDVAHIFGTARSFQSGSSTYGIFRKFQGDFEAVNLESGEIFRSANLLVPGLIEEMIMAALVAAGATAGKVRTADEKGSDGEPATSPVEFAFCVGVKPVPKGEGKRASGSGYEFTVKPLIESKGADSLAHLREVSQKHLRALPAPGKTTADAPAAAPVAPAAQAGGKHKK